MGDGGRRTRGTPEPEGILRAIVGTVLILGLAPAWVDAADNGFSCEVVDTGQDGCYNASNSIAAPGPGDAFAGQDAQYAGNMPSYSFGSGGLVVHDSVTGLTWQ